MISKKVKCVTYYDPKNPQTNKNTKKKVIWIKPKKQQKLEER